MKMKKYWLFGFLFALTSVISSCTDELEQSRQRLAGFLNFEVGEKSSWAEGDAPTRSMVEAPVRLDCSLEGTPLYMHTEVIASAPVPVSGVVEETPSTRGIRYTEDVFSPSLGGTNDSRPRISNFGVYAKRDADHAPVLSYVEITPSTTDATNQSYVHGNNESDYAWNVKNAEEIETVWDSGNATFYGYAPFFGTAGNPSDATQGVSIALSNNEPVLTYVAPENAANQPDILTARHTVSHSSEINVKLEFDHIMSAIKFRFNKGHKYNESDPTNPIENSNLQWSDGVNTYNVTVTKIEILGAYKKGTYKLGDDPYNSSDTRWTVDTEAGKANFTCNLTKELSDGTEAIYLTPDYETATTGNVFMMVPQDLTADHKMRLTCTLVNKDNATDTKTMVASMSLNNVTDSKWKPGYTYVYQISLSDVTYVFDFNTAAVINKPESGAIGTSGQDYDIEVRSYKVDVNGTKTAVSWKAQHPVVVAPVAGVGTEQEQTVWRNGTPSWIQLWDNKGLGTTQQVTGRHDGATLDSDQKNWWYQLKVLDIGVPVIDLSLYDHYQKKQWKRSTANCYIVSSPGTYLIPLVYGNAITNGEENEKAYKSDKAASDHVMKVLKNNTGTDISSPYIQLERPAKEAGILWDEVDGIIKNVCIDQTVDGPDGYKKERGYLKFTIDPEKFKYGNAVLYVTDNSDKILWSWHIWMIDPDEFEKDMTTIALESGGHNMTYAKQNIGWVDGGKTYDPTYRDGRIKLVQDETNDSLFINVNQQKSAAFTTQFTNVLYQWGRKDPMLGIVSNQRRSLTSPFNNGAAPRENSKYSFTRSYNTGKVDLETLIMNPNTIYGQPQGDLYNDPLNGATRGGAYNLWGINCDKAKKTYNFYGKTVYDPSPVGFCVPPSKAFTKLVKDNFKENGNYQGSGNGDNPLIVPYCTDNTFSTTLLEFPCCGQRSTDASLQLQASGYYRASHATGYYHSASPYSGDEDYQLRIDVYTNSILFIPVTDTHVLGLRGDQSSAMFVRPVVYRGETNIAESDVEDPKESPLTFIINSSGAITWTRNIGTATAREIEWSKKESGSENWSDWTTISSGSSNRIEVNAGDQVRFRTHTKESGDEDDVPSNTEYGNYTWPNYYWSQFNCTASFELYGNIMSMVYPDTYEEMEELPQSYRDGLNVSHTCDYTFCRMFYNCTTLTSAENLVLPAKTLTKDCYDGMFMGCTNLTKAPALPATDLKNYCYYQMFKGCTSLTEAPVLPAISLVDNCYEEMFNGCSSLSYIKAMFTTTPSNDYTKNWVAGVSSSGSFVKNSAANWNVTGSNGVPSGWNVSSVSASRRNASRR